MATKDLDIYRATFAADIPARARLFIRAVSHGNVMATIDAKQGGMTVVSVEDSAPEAVKDAVKQWETARRAVICYADSMRWACEDAK